MNLVWKDTAADQCFLDRKITLNLLENSRKVKKINSLVILMSLEDDAELNETSRAILKILLEEMPQEKQEDLVRRYKANYAKWEKELKPFIEAAERSQILTAKDYNPRVGVYS